MPPVAFRNGRLLPLEELTISFADLGFVQGATLTDTARTYHRRLFRWPDHMARLRHDAKELGFPFPWSDAELTTAAEAVLDSHPTDADYALVTFVTPGLAPRFTITGQATDPTLGMHAYRLPTPGLARMLHNGAKLVLAGTHPQGGFPNPAADAKHRSRLYWYRAELLARAVHPQGIALLTDERGEAGDTPLAALCAVRHGAVLASPAGTVQASISRRVVRELCQQEQIPYQEVPFVVRPDACTGGELFLAGTAFGITPVQAIYKPPNTPGDAAGIASRPSWESPRNWAMILRLQHAWSELVGMDIAAEWR